MCDLIVLETSKADGKHLREGMRSPKYVRCSWAVNYASNNTETGIIRSASNTTTASFWAWLSHPVRDKGAASVGTIAGKTLGKP